MFKSLKFYSLSFGLIFFLAPYFLYSQTQTKDSSSYVIDSLMVFGVSESSFTFPSIEKNKFEIDTSLFGFQKNENFYHEQPFFARYGNSGLAERNLIFQNDYDFDQISSHKYFSHYFFNNSNALYYNTLTPFSSVYYMMGHKREQAFDVFLTRNFGELLNFSVDYYLLYSPGIYKNQKSNDNFVTVNSNFHSKNKKYSFLADYFYNRMKMQENGGITNDSDFTQNFEPSREFIDVNLGNEGLTVIENRVKESGIYLRQFYFPGYSQNNKDTIRGNEKYFAFGRFSHSILFKNIKEVYYDGNPESGFYQNIFFPDSSATHDSLQVNFIENKIEWSNVKYNKVDSLEQHFLFSIGAKHRKQHIYSLDTVANINAIIAEAECNILFKPVEIYINGFYITSGYNKNDYCINGKMDYFLDGKNDYERLLSTGISSISQTPCWFDQHYSSNHFQWDYEFVKINTNKLFLKYSDGKLNSEISFTNLNNPVYYDNFARPKQIMGSSQLICISLEKLFKWKKWSFDNEIVVQKISGSDVIRLPEIMTNHSLYFSKDFFNKALSAQFGVDVTFFSSYYPLAYMPATRQFYLQNDYKSTAYPYIDLFINFKIKRVRVFFKLDNVNSGMFGYDYIMIPHYPMADRSLKFGLSWIFYN